MCVTNVYVDRYPDGREVEFRQLSLCPYGRPGQPCQKLATLTNPVRKIQLGEPTSEYIMTAHQRSFPPTPSRSPGGSHHRLSGGYASSEDGRMQRRSSMRRPEPAPLRPTRQHRRDRIIVVEAPPTPRTPPQLFQQTFSVPSSPATPAYAVDGHQRGRPIIVDERTLHTRAPSASAVIGSRRHARSPLRQWDSPSTSHSSFDSRARREAEEAEARARERERRHREERLAALEAERRNEERKARQRQADMEKEARMRQQNAEINSRPAVPMAPTPILRRTNTYRPVVDQTAAVTSMLGGLAVRDSLSPGEKALAEEAEIRRRLDVRDKELRKRLETEEEERLRQRLRERQLPKRRFSVGPGGRRHRVLYDDGMYRWE